jgi:hypothetical protein
VVSPADRPLRYPITGTAGCCARAASGHAAVRTAEECDELAPLGFAAQLASRYSEALAGANEGDYRTHHVIALMRE